MRFNPKSGQSSDSATNDLQPAKKPSKSTTQTKTRPYPRNTTRTSNRCEFQILYNEFFACTHSNLSTNPQTQSQGTDKAKADTHTPNGKLNHG
jgi:hypothetical protein